MFSVNIGVTFDWPTEIWANLGLSVFVHTGDTNMNWFGFGQGVVSLTFRELSKIISRKYTMPVITFMVRISRWNFERVPKAWLQLVILTINVITGIVYFREIILESSRNVSETTPRSTTCVHIWYVALMNWELVKYIPLTDWHLVKYVPWTDWFQIWSPV